MSDNPSKSTSTNTQQSEAQPSSQFVGFQIGDQRYAFRIEQIQEIVILNQITQLPQMPDYVEGVSNLRGSIIPIINLRKFFGLEAAPGDSETRTIVLNVRDKVMGCTVDMVSQVIRLAPGEIQLPPDTMTGEGVKYITGLAKQDGHLLILLDVNLLLNPDAFDLRTSGLEAFGQDELSKNKR